MQGDVVVVPDTGPMLVVTHACSMRRGAALYDSQMVAPVLDHAVPSWDGSYDWMPLPALPLPSMHEPAACLRELRSIATGQLVSGKRVAIMSNQGIQLLQQRLAHHLTRVVIPTAELAEHCAPILAEAELHEDWVGALGGGDEAEFHRLLDAEDRKLRSWLAEPSRRNQAMSTVRREIRRRLQDG